MKSPFSDFGGPSLARPVPIPARPGEDDAGDAAALRGIANGDRESYRQLCERYRNLLFSTIDKVLGDRHDSEEVLQEVHFALWRKAALFRPDRGRPVTWLVSLARNRAIDRLRARQRRIRLQQAYAEELPALTSRTAAINGREAAQRREDCAGVRQAVSGLNPLQREAIAMAYFEGLTQKEIARRIGQPVGTVKARIRRGLASLRRSMDQA